MSSVLQYREHLASVSECFSALETMLERGGWLGDHNVSIEFDPQHGESLEPLFVLVRWVNGRKETTLHQTLLEAMQAWVKV